MYTRGTIRMAQRLIGLQSCGGRSKSLCCNSMVVNRCSIVIVLLAVTVFADYVLQPADEGYSVGEIGSGLGQPLQLVNVTLPLCMDDEFLTSDGTALVCRPLPEPICDCPELETGGGDIPLPPNGCPVFEPPTRGAYMCLRNPDIIYCSVFCDHRFEFSTSPRNPYFCGNSTNFQWMDEARHTHEELPRCTGFRHRLRLLHPIDFYLPAPCYGVTNHTIVAIMFEFHAALIDLGCMDCNVSSVYIQCPNVDGSARFFSDITIRSYK